MTHRLPPCWCREEGRMDTAGLRRTPDTALRSLESQGLTSGALASRQGAGLGLSERLPVH